jgi:uncharacterized protein
MIGAAMRNEQIQTAANLRNLVHTILAQFTLAPAGEHGVAHWARVLENGLCLAPLTGANIAVVQLFAVLHDSRRISDADDPDHGQRAAAYAAALHSVHFTLTDTELDLLCTACADHANGLTVGDRTVQTCWDADRLDLGRGGIVPNPRYLCTAAAKQPEMIAWATDRARQDHVPALVYHDWAALALPATSLLTRTAP